MNRIVWATLVVALSAFAGDKSGTRATAISVPHGPGSVEGLGESFQINLNSGSVSETVPLKLPPGSGGQTPSLALHYDSGQGNGPIGIGWSLGLPAIQLRTERGLPHYDGTDTLLFQGAELVPLASGVYRLKIEGRFLRVRASGEGFEVDQPNGTVLRFGLSADARIENGTSKYAWTLEDEIDVFGNRVSYFYEKDGGMPYLSRVEYNRRVGAAQNAVTFEWERRPDALTDYQPTFKTILARRLKTIRVFSNGVLLRRYVLSYQMGTGLSLLASVTAFGEDDTTALPSLAFGYSAFSFANARVVSVSAAPANLPGASPDVELTDIDGDGFPDLLEATTAVHRWSRNNGGTSFEAPRAIGGAPNVALSTTGVELTDLNGDGMADLVARTGTTPAAFRFFSPTGTGGWSSSTVFSNNPSFPIEDGTTRFVDLDADRLPDAFRLTASSVSWWRNNGDGSWAAPETLSAPPGQATLDFMDPRVKLIDMNGDRLVDLVFVRSGSIRWWPGMGRGRFDTSNSVAGAPDFGTNNELNVQLADLNGDGLADLLLNEVDHVTAWIQQPSGGFAMSTTVTGTPYANASLTWFRLGDLNGNGSTDLAWFTPSAAVNSRVQYLDFQPGMRPNLLTRVENDLGLVRTLTYTSSASRYQAALDAGKPWATRVPFPVQVASASSISDSRGHTFDTTYDYRDGFYHSLLREFRGFKEVSVQELGDADEPTSIAVHAFDVGEISECLKGRETSTELRGADGFLFSRTETDLTARTYATGTNGVVVAGGEVPEQRTLVFEGQSTPVRLVERSKFDEFGNQTWHLNAGRVDNGQIDAGNDETLIERRYLNDTTSWILGRSIEEKTEALDGTTVRWSRNYYDGEAFVGLPFGQMTSGVLTRQESWVSGTEWVQRSRVRRDEYGNVAATLTPGGAERDLTWDATHTYPLAETFAVDATTHFAVSATYGPTGLVTSFTDVSGATTRFFYDPLRRLTSLFKPGDPDDSPTLSWVYTLGSPLSSVETLTRAVPGEPPTRTIQISDGLGRPLASAHQAENQQWMIEGRKEYSRHGSVVTEYDPFFARAPELVEMLAVPFVHHQYDAAGRIRTTTFSDLSHTEVRYGQLSRELWDAENLNPASKHANTPTRYLSDGQGRTTSIIELLGAAPSTTTLAFDAAGGSLGLVDALGRKTTNQLDGLGRVVQVIHPDAGKRQYQYDADGNMFRSTDARRQVVSRTWDAASRPLLELQLDASGAEVSRVEYHYDAPNLRFPDAAYSVGQLSWVKDAAGEEYFKYDQRGHLVSDLRVVDGTDYLLQQAFDGLDRVTSLVYPDGWSLPYSYNERGLVASIPGILTSATYDARGKATRRELVNGVVSTADYDEHERVKRIESTNKAGKQLQSLTYGYDGAGTLLSIQDSVHAAGSNNASWVFEYDDLYRLTKATGATTVSNQYDPVGNLLQKSDLGAYAYDDPAHVGAVTAIGGRPVAYDENGNTISGLGRALTWNPAGQLTRVVTERGTTDSVYDYTGARFRKTVHGAKDSTTLYLDKYAELRDGVLVKYVFAGDTRLARIGGETPKVIQVASASVGPLGLLFVLGALVMAVLRRSRAARKLLTCFTLVAFTSCTCGVGPPVKGALFYLDDHLGSTSVLVDGDGNLAGEDNFDAWGAPLALTNEPYGFAGTEYDAEAGLQHMGARSLDPRIGRFISPDLSLLARADLGVDDPQSLNFYSYARNTPTSLHDKSGRFPHILAGALIGLAVGSAVYLAKAAYNGTEVDGRQLAAAAIGGAVAGAIGAATLGVGLVASGAISGAVGGVVERGISTGSAAEAFNPSSVAGDAVIGGLTAGLIKAGGSAVSKVAGAVKGRFGGALATVVEDVKAGACTGGTCKVGPGCFVAGTPVALASGEQKPIEAIVVGDVVWSADEALGWQLVPRRVSEILRRDVDLVVDVLVRDSSDLTELVTTTMEHPFLVEDGGRRWVAAGKLRAGMRVVSRNGLVVVQSAGVRPELTTVFNLTVEESHSYIVGKLGEVVHNAECGLGSASDWTELSGKLRDAARGKGNFGVGEATREQAEAMGKAWVGPKSRVASDGKSLVSEDGLRIFRPPSAKPRLGKIQANLEQKVTEGGVPTGNAHIDIVGP